MTKKVQVSTKVPKEKQTLEFESFKFDVEIFKQYEPQALKCKLYGVYAPSGNEFTEAENLVFKNHIANKLFSAKLINYNEIEGIYEVSLNDVNSIKRSVHEYLVENKLGNLCIYI